MPQKSGNRPGHLVRTAGPTQELRDNEQRFRLTFELAAVGIAHVAPDGQFLRVNHQLCRILGYERSEFTQLRFQDITSHEDLPSCRRRINQLLAGSIDTYNQENRYHHKAGHIVWGRLTVSLVRDSEQQPSYFICVLEDITDRKGKEAELQQTRERLEHTNQKLTLLARTDSLTHCMNRHAFMEELHKVWLYHQRYARLCTLAFIDINEFKTINDQYGHLIGDRALCRLAHHIRSSLRDTDSIGRYAGDEFLVLLQEVDYCQADKIMHGIQERPIFIDTPNQQSFKLDYAIGLASIDEPFINDVEQWVGLADERMYQSKDTPYHCQ